MKKNIHQYEKLYANTLIKGFPELAIGVGYGTTEILESIKKRSNGKTKIAIILDPLKDYEIFDFIILPSYEPYHIEGENVLRTKGLINYINQDFLNEKIKELETSPKYEFLRREFNSKLQPPYLAVLVGGKHTGGNVDSNDAKKLAEMVNEFIEKSGGTALITTSHRTEYETTKILKENIKINHYFYDYKERDSENPYDIFLAKANRIIVSGDSVRMMSEAISTNKICYIFSPKTLGFQYEPLISEFVEDKKAIILNDVSDFNKEFEIKLENFNEAKRIAEIIKQKI